jgi:heptosyltransferase-2
MQERWIDDWLVYKPRSASSLLNRRRLVTELRRRRCDAAILLTNSLSSAVMASVSGIPRRIGYARDGRRWLLTDRIEVPKSLGRTVPMSAIDYYLKLAEYFGCPSIAREMELNVFQTAHDQAAQLFKDLGFSPKRPTVVINNHAANNPERLWPADYVERLAIKLARTMNVQVLFHCGPSEAEVSNQMAKRIHHPMVGSMGIASELPLGLSLAVFSRAAAVVTTDSGARHMAVAMNRPVITLFGATSPAWTLTYNLPESKLQAEYPCPRCVSRSGRKNGAGPQCECMKLIKPERVYAEIAGRLSHIDSTSHQAAA